MKTIDTQSAQGTKLKVPLRLNLQRRTKLCQDHTTTADQWQAKKRCVKVFTSSMMQTQYFYFWVDFFYSLCCGQDTRSLLRRYRADRMLSMDIEDVKWSETAVQFRETKWRVSSKRVPRKFFFEFSQNFNGSSCRSESVSIGKASKSDHAISSSAPATMRSEGSDLEIFTGRYSLWFYIYSAWFRKTRIWTWHIVNTIMIYSDYLKNLWHLICKKYLYKDEFESYIKEGGLSMHTVFSFFFNLQARATSDRSRQFRRQYENYTSGWLYNWRSLEKFLRLTQKIPISLSGAKVEGHRDATK